MRRAAVASVLFGLVMLAVPVVGAAGTEEGVTYLRRLTAGYHDAERAVADGFTATEECVAHPDLGGMGYHYVNVARVDATLDVDQPEAVLYQPTANGRRAMVAVEYIVVDHDQDLTTDDDRPTLFGHPFDGPMPGHSPGMPIHYDLHAWVWLDNPNGTWTPWNPDVSC